MAAERARATPRAGMCLHRGTRSNGTFTVGGLDPRLYTGEFAWAKNVGGGGLYEMPLAGITVGGKPVKVRARPPSAAPRAVDSDSGPARSCGQPDHAASCLPDICPRCGAARRWYGGPQRLQQL